MQIKGKKLSYFTDFNYSLFSIKDKNNEYQALLQVKINICKFKKSFLIYNVDLIFNVGSIACYRQH